MKGLGRVIFLAHAEPIRNLLDRGYTMKSIYQLYQHELRISYCQFCRYVNRYLGGGRERKHSKQNKEDDVAKLAEN